MDMLDEPLPIQLIALFPASVKLDGERINQVLGSSKITASNVKKPYNSQAKRFDDGEKHQSGTTGPKPQVELQEFQETRVGIYS